MFPSDSAAAVRKADRNPREAIRSAADRVVNVSIDCPQRLGNVQTAVAIDVSPPRQPAQLGTASAAAGPDFPNA